MLFTFIPLKWLQLLLPPSFRIGNNRLRFWGSWLRCDILEVLSSSFIYFKFLITFQVSLKSICRHFSVEPLILLKYLLCFNIFLAFRLYSISCTVIAFHSFYNFFILTPPLLFIVFSIFCNKLYEELFKFSTVMLNTAYLQVFDIRFPL